jgi:hypothetical protein
VSVIDANGLAQHSPTLPRGRSREAIWVQGLAELAVPRVEFGQLQGKSWLDSERIESVVRHGFEGSSEHTGGPAVHFTGFTLRFAVTSQ